MNRTEKAYLLLGACLYYGSVGLVKAMKFLTVYALFHLFAQATGWHFPPFF